MQGEPQALLLVEFSGENHDDQIKGLKQLGELMGDLGFPNSVVEATDDFQNEIWEVRKSGLNIMMSMKGDDGKPISFIEDCAVPLEDLAEYTRRLTDVFRKNMGQLALFMPMHLFGTLHVRPVLNMKEASGSTKMRDIVEETMAMVREYKGSHSGEHGDGISLFQNFMS